MALKEMRTAGGVVAPAGGEGFEGKLTEEMKGKSDEELMEELEGLEMELQGLDAEGGKEKTQTLKLTAGMSDAPLRLATQRRRYAKN